MVFDDEFSTVLVMREVTISQNWTYLVQSSSHIGAPDNIETKDTWFTTYPKEYSSEIPSHDMRVYPENNNKMLISPQSKPHIQEILNSKGASVSEVIKHPVS